MNIILLTKSRKSPLNLHLRRSTVLGLMSAALMTPLLFIATGYKLAQMSAQSASMQVAAGGAPEGGTVAQLGQLETVVRDAREGVNALTLRVGQLQARIIRLDALGKRLVEVANLDKGEFDFDHPPAQGGPAETSHLEPVKIPDFLKELDRLEQQLADREQQLTALESVLMSRTLQAEVFPTGRPVKKGWASSHFGYRTDPFTGKRAFHYGVDFAGVEGSDIISVAAGVVTYAGKKYGYGNLVEVDHGNGISTRYGHNKVILVKVGEKVEKGQVLAKMGSSGRSTGPHVHFEVLKNNKHVNPIRYVKAAAR